MIKLPNGLVKWGSREVTEEQALRYLAKQKEKQKERQEKKEEKEKQSAESEKRELIDKVVIKILKRLYREIDKYDSKTMASIIKILPSIIDTKCDSNEATGILSQLMDSKDKENQDD